MDGCEMLAGMIKANQSGGGATILIGTMSGPDSCKIGTLPLEREDLYIPDYLLTGYLISCTGKGEFVRPGEFILMDPLKEGDMIAITRLSDEKYVVLARVV